MKNIKIGGNVRNIHPVYAGESYEPVIIASVGVSKTDDSIGKEIEKAKRAEELGASVIADHSLIDSSSAVQESISQSISIPFSTIPVYEASVRARKTNGVIGPDKMLRIIEDQAKRGADMLTLHATVLRDDGGLLNCSDRLIPSTSRGGTMMMEILRASQMENPYWEYFDDVLDIAGKYNLTISLGTCFRPASVYDCVNSNSLYFMEIKRMGELVRRADEKGIGVVVEGIGHAPLNHIESVVKQSKEFCGQAPYRVLTVATDIALGYDHIASAIGSANAVYHGADMVTCVSRAEHIGLPSLSDMEEAVITARIAAYAGFSARQNSFGRDREMSVARSLSGCGGLISAAIYPEGAKEALRKRRHAEGMKGCGMCGEFCALDALERLENGGNYE